MGKREETLVAVRDGDRPSVGTATLPGPSRAFADIGSHWRDPVGVNNDERISAVCAQPATVFAEAADGGASAPDIAAALEESVTSVTTEDAVKAVFRIASGTHGSMVVSQVSPGRTNRLHAEIDRAQTGVGFEQERPETLWPGRRGTSEIVTRGSGTLGPGAGPYAVVPAGHPHGYHDRFALFVADAYAALRDGEAPDGFPRFAHGARSAHLIDAVLASAAAGAWVEVP